MLLRGSGWTTRLDAHAYAASLKHSRGVHFALPIACLAGALCLAGSSIAVYRTSTLLRIANQPPLTRASSSGTPTVAAKVNSQSSARDVFVTELPAAALTDPQFRFAAKIAREQEVSIAQMQSESLKSDPNTLGQTRLTLQVRGDYRAIKNLWIALLAKYPGLTLERLTLRHHAESTVPAPQQSAAPASPSADRGEDEADIALIQYTQPAALSR